MILVLCLLSGCGTKQEYSREIDVVSSRGMSASNFYSEDITVILNRSEVVDYEECAKGIIEHCIQNDFQSIRFSYDV